MYGGNFAVWGGLLSSIDCSLICLRGKEDPWNSVLAGSTASGMLALRTGMVVDAIVGAVILGLFESISIAMTRYQATQQRELTFQQVLIISHLYTPVCLYICLFRRLILQKFEQD